MRIDFDPHAAASPLGCGNVGGRGTHEGVEDGIPNKAEHPNEALGQLQRIGGGMALGRGTGYSCPDLLEPCREIFGRNNA